MTKKLLPFSPEKTLVKITCKKKLERRAEKFKFFHSILIFLIFFPFSYCSEKIDSSSEEEQEIQNIIEENPSDQIKAIKIYNLGQKKFLAGKNEKAEKLYRQALNFKPDLGIIHFALGNALIRKGDYLGGLSEMDLAYKSGFSEADLFINMGIANLCLNQPDIAKDNFQKAILKNSTDIGLIYNLALLNIRTNEYEVAKFYLKEVLRRDYYFENSSYLYKKLSKIKSNQLSAETTFRARHILMKNKQDAEFILKKLIEGENFIKLAKQYSLESNGKIGGDTGTFKIEDVDDKFGTAVKNLQIGELSKIIETKAGFHIILRIQ